MFSSLLYYLNIIFILRVHNKTKFSVKLFNRRKTVLEVFPIVNFSVGLLDFRSHTLIPGMMVLIRIMCSGEDR